MYAMTATSALLPSTTRDTWQGFSEIGSRASRPHQHLVSKPQGNTRKSFVSRSALSAGGTPAIRYELRLSDDHSVASRFRSAAVQSQIALMSASDNFALR